MVDPRISLDAEAVAVAAKRVGSHADDVRLSHSCARTRLDDALYGCVGRSGDELSALSARWAAVEARHGERLDSLSTLVRAAGVKLTDEDRRNATRVARVADEAANL
jgi:hypothetical protein